jgi:pilus assembly protein CpaF
MMVAMTGLELPISVVRQYIAAGIRLVVHLSRLQGGARKILRISEVLGLENGSFRIEDIFGYRQTGVDAEKNAVGQFYATGYRPACLERLQTSGAPIADDWFTARAFPDETAAP